MNRNEITVMKEMGNGKVLEVKMFVPSPMIADATTIVTEITVMLSIIVDTSPLIAEKVLIANEAIDLRISSDLLSSTKI